MLKTMETSTQLQKMRLTVTGVNAKPTKKAMLTISCAHLMA